VSFILVLVWLVVLRMCCVCICVVGLNGVLLTSRTTGAVGSVAVLALSPCVHEVVLLRVGEGASLVAC